jgi:hypothetical protein
LFYFGNKEIENRKKKWKSSHLIQKIIFVNYQKSGGC